MNQLRQTKTVLYEFITVLSDNRKISLRYILILLPAAICMGAVCFIDTGIGSRLPSKILQLLLFSTAGILHLYFLKQKISLHWFRFLGDGILYTSSAALLILLSLVVFYLFAGHHGSMMMAIASSVVFALPHIILHAWYLYTEIPAKEFPTWTKPIHYDKSDEILFTEPVLIELKIRRKYFDVTEQGFKRNVAVHTKLGAVFFEVLKEENKGDAADIDFFDSKKNLYAWEFYTSQLRGYIHPRRLDPELTIAENGLNSNAVVIVKRTLQSKEKLSINVFSRN